MTRSGLVPSLVLGALAVGLDRGHKWLMIDQLNWRGGERLPVTGFFDLVLAWNTGISYGLLSGLPVGVIAAIMMAAALILLVWWWRAETALTRAALALSLGGALSNGFDRWRYGAVADFFHFYWRDWSFYVFNIADTAISVGVALLILDIFLQTRHAPPGNS